jgi:hypothetical protein
LVKAIERKWAAKALSISAKKGGVLWVRAEDAG